MGVRWLSMSRHSSCEFVHPDEGERSLRVLDGDTGSFGSSAVWSSVSIHQLLCFDDIDVSTQ